MTCVSEMIMSEPSDYAKSRESRASQFIGLREAFRTLESSLHLKKIISRISWVFFLKENININKTKNTFHSTNP